MPSKLDPNASRRVASEVLEEAAGLLTLVERRAEELLHVSGDLPELSPAAVRFHAAVQAAADQLRCVRERLGDAASNDRSARCG